MSDEVDEVELADVVGLLLAHVRRDEVSCQQLLDVLGVEDGTRCMSLGIGLLVDLAGRLLPGGRGELEELLADWQRERRAGL